MTPSVRGLSSDRNWTLFSKDKDLRLSLFLQSVLDSNRGKLVPAMIGQFGNCCCTSCLTKCDSRCKLAWRLWEDYCTMTDHCQYLFQWSTGLRSWSKACAAWSYWRAWYGGRLTASCSTTFPLSHRHSSKAPLWFWVSLPSNPLECLACLNSLIYRGGRCM